MIWYLIKNTINMVSVGKLVPSKGYDRLLRIHNRLIKEGFAIHTYILELGNMKMNLENL